LFATLFPADCRVCGDLLLNISRLPVCPACLEKIEPFEKPVCKTCGELLPERASVSLEQCVSCEHVKLAFESAQAYGPYEGVLRELIHLLKYDRVRSAAGPLGQVIAAKLKQVGFGEKALLVPVPLFKAKYRARGFNQAEEIARAVRKHAGLALNPYVMARRRDTGSQTGLTPLQRRENVRGAFHVRRRALRDIQGRNIILLDDVLTTGATANECARVLRKAGAAKVWVVTAARVTRMFALGLERREEFAAQAAGV
jgi:ComF family protein